MKNPPMDLEHSKIIAGITAVSVLNSIGKTVEDFIYKKRFMQDSAISPLFILGHWRSGTTYLHNLLGRDPQYAYPSLYQTSFPDHFLWSEKYLSSFVGQFVPKIRPMDNMELGIDLPNEDELAICLMTSYSPYIMWAFPGMREKYEKYYDLKNLTTSELDEWKSSMKLFINKMSIRFPDKRLVLKSPTHTFRMKMLSDLFPQAQFVHIVRNPYTVFRSTMHLQKKVFPLSMLANGNFDFLKEEVLYTCNKMYEAFENDRKLINQSQLIEIKYEDLDKDPMLKIKQIYDYFGFEMQPQYISNLEAFFSKVKNHQKNKFTDLDMDTKKEIHKRWRVIFDRFGYDPEF